MSQDQLPCPACGAALPDKAILCVACGYHLKLGHHLATAVGAEPDQPKPSDENPYAASHIATPTARSSAGGTENFDLTDYGAERAKAIVSDADTVLLLSVLACICAPIWLLLFPWFGYRLYCWYDLRSTYHELRYPNSFSPHGELAGRFENAQWKLIVGTCLGGFLWLLLAARMLLYRL